MTDPGLIYRELLEVAPAGAGRTFRAFGGPEYLTIRAFVEGTTRVPGLSIECRKSDIPAGFTLPDMRGAEIRRGLHGHTTCVFDIVSAGPAYIPVFVELAAALVTDASSAKSPRDALLLVARRLTAWARFFEVCEDTTLSRSRQLGLLGELLCLQALVNEVGVAMAVSSWFGPEGGPHDFIGSSGAVEVKLTTTAAPERFRIGSARQLDETPMGTLFLYAVIAQESPQGGTHLPGIVRALRGRIDNEAPTVAPLFEDRLLSAGFLEHPRMASQWVLLSIRTEALIRIAGSVPRIIQSALPAGIASLHYEILWSALAPYRVAPSVVAEAFA